MLPEYKLLSDEPLKGDELNKIEFGHQYIAEVIADIVQKADSPFTIGLFSRWGTGKSTIINIIRGKLKDKKVETVTFDAWKYEQDSLRRQFLINLDEQLGLNKNYKNTLNQSLVVPKDFAEESFRIAIHNFVTRTLLLFIGILIIIVLIINNFLSISEFYKVIFDTAIIAFFIQYILNAFNTVYGSIQKNKIDSAEGFENEFRESILKNDTIGKLLIIIDNLDRTSHEQAVNLLSDIKTFLSQDNCVKDKSGTEVIFLIACDEDAIKKHLAECRFNNPDEFLRKFFNTSFRVPKYLSIELDKYTKNRLSETEVEPFIKDDDLLRLITGEFKDNPREIKQFINTLLITYLYARQMEDAGEIASKGFADTHISALAKLLIIRQKFPGTYEIIEERVTKGIFSHKDLSSSLCDSSDSQEAFSDFLDRTYYVDMSDIGVLVRLRQSDQERNISNIDPIIIAIKSRNKDDFKLIIDGMDEKKLFELSDYLRNYIRREGIDIKEVYSVGACVLNLGKEKVGHFKAFIEEFILLFPYEKDLLSRLSDFPPTEIFQKIFDIVGGRGRKKLVENYIELFSLKGDRRSPDPLEMSVVKEIFELSLDDNYSEYFKPYDSMIIDMLKRGTVMPECRQIFAGTIFEKEHITDDVVKSYINGLNFDSIDEITSEVYDGLGKIDLSSYIPDILNKLGEFLLPSHPLHLDKDFKRMRIVLDSLNKIFDKYKINIFEYYKTDKGKNFIENFTSNAVFSFSEYGKSNIGRYISLLLKLRKYKGNSKTGNIDDAIRKYLNEPISIDIIKTISKDDLMRLKDIYPGEINSVANKYPAIGDMIKSNN